MPRDDFDDNVYARYASLRNPEDSQQLPSSVYVWHSARSLTIEEPYKKAYIHVLLMPRIGAPPFTEHNLVDLHTLLTSPEISKDEAHQLLLGLKEDAMVVKSLCQQEMLRLKECKWSIWMGFHPAPMLKCVLISSCDLLR